jgi:hypothetical protein
MKIRTTLRPLSEEVFFAIGEISTLLGDEYVGLSLQIVLAQKIPMVFEEKNGGYPQFSSILDWDVPLPSSDKGVPPI